MQVRLLDAIGPDELLDATARERWRGEARDYDASAFFDELPEGPDDPTVPEESVAAVRELIEGLREDSKGRVIGRRARGQSSNDATTLQQDVIE
jgi:hypothetical protein